MWEHAISANGLAHALFMIVPYRTGTEGRSSFLRLLLHLRPLRPGRVARTPRPARGPRRRPRPRPRPAPRLAGVRPAADPSSRAVRPAHRARGQRPERGDDKAPSHGTVRDSALWLLPPDGARLARQDVRTAGRSRLGRCVPARAGGSVRSPCTERIGWDRGGRRRELRLRLPQVKRRASEPITTALARTPATVLVLPSPRTTPHPGPRVGLSTRGLTSRQAPGTAVRLRRRAGRARPPRRDGRSRRPRRGSEPGSSR